MRSLWILLASSALAVVAHAAPVTWALSVAFTDGSTATGSFVFDANTVSYSSINIVTNTPTVGGTFQFVCVSPCTAGAPSATQVLFLAESSSNNLAAAHALALVFQAPLTNAGGVDNISFGQGGLCADATCSVPSSSPSPVPVNSSSFVESVPEAQSTLLVMIGLAGIAAARYRVRRARD
jgi:hypothetical protein